MCGRYVIKATPEEIELAFRVNDIIADVKDNYNVAPTQTVYAIVRHDSKSRLESMRWGLVPSSTKPDRMKEKAPGVWVRSGGPEWINTRTESFDENSWFKKFLNRRCLMPAWAFYEFRTVGKTKVPFLYQLESQAPFVFAGHYDTWKTPKGDSINTCSIITTTPNELVAKIHDRMPVILDEEGQKIWLDPSVTDYDTLRSVLKPFPAEEMTTYQVSSDVNRPQNNSPELIKPVG